MSKTWKWILGILVVLVVAAAIMAVAGFAWQRHNVIMADYGAFPMDRNWNGPMMGRGDDAWNRQPGFGQCDGRGYPMMEGRHGFGPMGGGFFVFGLIGGLLKLALFFGLLYFAYWLGRRNARLALDPAPAAAVAAVPAVGPAPAVEPSSPSPEAKSQTAPRKRAKRSS
jgi:hypothetical protein